jgi:hypothetical protein
MIDSRLQKTALLVAGCFLMENLDGTIVTTTPPRIGRALHVAPLAGGVITTYASWRWLFLVNVPLGVLALIAVTATAGSLRLHPDAGAAVTRRPSPEPTPATTASHSG